MVGSSGGLAQLSALIAFDHGRADHKETLASGDDVEGNPWMQEAYRSVKLHLLGTK